MTKARLLRVSLLANILDRVESGQVVMSDVSYWGEVRKIGSDITHITERRALFTQIGS